MGTGDTTYQRTSVDCGPSTGHVITTPLVNRTATPSSDALTERSLKVWSAGDYDSISAGFRDEAEAFVRRRELGATDLVLDAACGSGNLTIPAARTGARVVGLDLVPSLLELAELWTRNEDLSVQLDTGNVEELPYTEAAFDVVLSMFGVMFAARPDRVVEEFARVTRKGGRVALANWTREGFIGKMFAIHGAHLKPSVEIPSPLLWGDEATIRGRFDEAQWEVTTQRRMLTFRYPGTPEDTANLFRSAYGPTLLLFAALDEEKRESLAEKLIAHWTAYQQPGAKGTVIESEYLEVVAVKK